MRGTKYTISLLAAVVLWATAAPMASATPEEQEPPPAAGDTATTVGSPLGQRYESLAGAMVQFYADRSGMTFESFLGSNGTEVATLVGLPDLAQSLPSVASFEQFELSLRSAGATLEVAGLTSYDDLLAELRAKSQSMDAQVTMLGASFAGSLATLHLPELALPELPALNATAPESLAFGLFVNESLIGLVSDHPDVFAQVSQSGLGTPEALAAWRASMLQAGTIVGNDLSRLPMPCVGEMLQAMASGSAAVSGSGCGACAVAGAYLHNQTLTLLDPNANTALASPANTAEVMQPWLNDALVAQNPSLAAELDQVLAPSNALAGCTTASSATSSALSAMLPDVFANLATGTGAPALPGGFGSLPTPPNAPGGPAVGAPPSSSPATLPVLPGGFGSLAPVDD